MRAIVHIGTEKTGTSTIQAFLDRNPQALAAHSMAYLRSAGRPSNRDLAAWAMPEIKIDDHIVQLGVTSADARRQWRAQVEKNLDTELSQLQGAVDTVLISSEHLQSRLNSLSEVQTLENLLSRYFDDIKILVYLRRQDRVAVSLYSTMCIAGGTQPYVLIPNIQESKPRYNYLAIIKRWSQFFGRDNLLIRNYDEAISTHGDVLQDFMQVTSLSGEAEFNKVARDNQKLSAGLQSVLLALNTAFPSVGDNQPLLLNQALKANVLQALKPQCSGPPRLPSRAQAENFYAVFSPSNHELARDWLNRDDIFSHDFSEYPDQPTPHQVTPELKQAALDAIQTFLNSDSPVLDNIKSTHTKARIMQEADICL